MKTFLVAASLAFAAPVTWLSLSAPAVAQSAIRTERLSFAPGQTSANVTRVIRGRQTIDFVVNARAGQRLAVSMRSTNRAAYFNLLAPGEQYVAFYTGDSSTPFNRFNGIVPKTGNMKIRVYLYRAAARRGELARVTLNVSITGRGGVATQLPSRPPAGGAGQLPSPPPMRPGSNYDATTILPCAFDGGLPEMRCNAGVKRRAGPNGETYVEIQRPGRSPRTIFFRGTEAFGADSAQSDGSASYKFQAIRRGDDTEILFGPERYIIADAVIVGG